MLSSALVLLACEQPSTIAQTSSEGGFTENEPTIVGVATVIDGDTIEIHGRRIRISGVDAPERGKMCGNINVYQRASLALSDQIGRQSVSCELSGNDRYGRAVGLCRVSGVDVAEQTTRAGWTRDWPRYSGRAYADEEAEARSARRGIWGLECPSDLWGERNYD
ncbi:MAG: thermonuclease family protein [Hyphomonadaceae bacterium]|nr:thermonuclease family protein [Hyphomonadaceae bacterium]